MAGPRISLCLIARDEELLLPGCLESVRGAVDEIVLVDTGSRDRTVELARSAGATVLARPWDDDFAAPRTLAARAARGEWILQLDADERLAPGAGRGLRRAAMEGGFVVGMLRLHNASRPDESPKEILSGAARRPCLVPRLLRNTSDLEYQGRIHEFVADWLARQGGSRRLVDADILHLGYVPATRAAKAKRERNLALLRRRCAEEGHGVVPAGYLSLELFQAGDLAGAHEVVERAWPAVDCAPKGQSILRLAMARAAIALRRGDAKVVLDSLERAERREGRHPDLDYLRGVAEEVRAVQSPPGSLERENSLRRAEAALRAGIDLLSGAVFEFTVTAEVDARLHLSSVHLLQNRPGEALREAGRALECDPRSPLAWTTAAEALLSAGQPARALEAVQRALGERADGWLIAAAAAFDLGARADARTFLFKARKHQSAGFEHLHRVARLRQLERALGEA
ncbi:MAG TPA: glycosyltransferase [Anaeromyxobacter sp.]|nr:glycosyltransferase [Anaeromyxobacter sp.]